MGTRRRHCSGNSSRARIDWRRAHLQTRNDGKDRATACTNTSSFGVDCCSNTNANTNTGTGTGTDT